MEVWQLCVKVMEALCQVTQHDQWKTAILAQSLGQELQQMKWHVHLLRDQMWSRG